MVVSFINQKGGVGKTTSVINLGACIAELGYKTLLVDFDPQANLTSGIGLHKKTPTIYDVLSNKATITESIRKSQHNNLFVVPSGSNLSGANIELVSLEKREWFLQHALVEITQDYDFIFIDCPPSLGLLTINAFCVSNSIIIPLQCEYFAMEGIAQLIKNIKLIQANHNPSLVIFGIVLTMYDVRTKLSQEVVSEIVTAFGSYVFKTLIPRNVRIAESPSFGQSVVTYDKNCVGTKSYQQLAEEVISRWKKQQETN